MKPYLTPWEYTASEWKQTSGESYNGYSKTYNPPLLYKTHRILSKGKAVVMETTLFASSSENRKIEANYHLIVKAVNKFMEEL